VILGGQGSITGAVLAAIVLTLVPEALRSAVPPSIMDANTIEKWRMVIYSLFIILSMLFMPRGLFGRWEITDLLRWVWEQVWGRPDAERPAAALGAEHPLEVTQLAAEAESEQPVPETEVLHVRGMTIRFGGLRAVDDFSLQVRSGEIVGLIGPNGAGKTTVFNALTGVYQPMAGQISVFGASILGLRPHSISRRGVARTFQNIRLFGNLSVLDNVQIAQHAHHRQGFVAAVIRSPWFYAEEAQSRARALGYLDIFGLSRHARAQASSLSYGDQRRLEIARALATRPKLLLLDEPAAGMNPTEKRELMEMIQSIRARFGLTILIIEHDMKVIMGICQRILVLDYGKTIAAGTPAEIRRNPAVIEAYLGASAKQG
jgi:branched-chain amino acid transport system ATP-binding protein